MFSNENNSFYTQARNLEMECQNAALKSDQKKSNRFLVKFFLWLLVVLPIMYMGFCQEKVEAYETDMHFTNYLWQCDCGYTNYEGIRYCPICGGKRPY